MRVFLLLLLSMKALSVEAVLSPFSVQGDLLYLTASSEGYSIGVERKGSSTFDSSTLTYLSSDFTKRIKLPKTASDLGVRFTFSYDCPCPSWGLSLTWWHQHADTGRAFQSDDPNVPTITPFTVQKLASDGFSYSPGDGVYSSLYGSHVKGHWGLDVDVVDFRFGSSSIHCPFRFDPSLLLRFLSHEQKLRIQAEGNVHLGRSFFIENEITLSSPFSSDEKLELCFTGIGPGIAFAADWEWCGGFGFYTDLGLALIYGKKETHSLATLQREVFEEIPSLDLHERRNSEYWCSRLMADLGVGLRFICGIDCFQVEAKLGWELHMFFNQGMGELDPPLQIYLSREGNQLNLQGLQAAIALHY